MDPDFDDLERIACGELGMTIPEFYDLTHRQFANILKGRREKEERHERTQWEIARSLMFTISSPYFEKKDRKKTVFEFYPLPWDPSHDPEPKAKKRTKKERDALFEKMQKLKQNPDV